MSIDIFGQKLKY